MNFWIHASLGGFWLVAVSCTLGNRLGHASAEEQANAAATAGRALSAEDARALSELIRELVLNNAPHEYEDTKKWGGTKEVWAGLKVSHDGILLKTKRRTKQVNHGTWERYRAWLIEPEKELKIRLENLRTEPGTDATFELLVASRLGAFARWAEWQRGIQLYSISADAEARVQLRMRCQLRLSLDPVTFPPELAIHPRVTDAELDLVDFRVIRLSKLDGPLVKQIGDGLHGALQREIDRRSPKLVTRINAVIEKHRDELRFSLGGLLDGRLHSSTPGETNASLASESKSER